MVNGRPTAFPEDEEDLRNDGSYPSGHTAVGWTWALILAELVPDKTDAIVLMEPDIEYRVLIRVMDALRSTFIRQLGAEGEADVLQQVALFPDISIGDAP